MAVIDPHAGVIIFYRDLIMEKRAIVAVILSLAVWLLWFYIAPPTEKPEQQVAKQEEQIPNQDAVQKQQKTVKPAATQVQKTSDFSRGVESAAAVDVVSRAGSSREYSVKTDRYAGELTNTGAAIDELFLRERDIQLVVKDNQFNAEGKFDFAMHFSEREFLTGNNLQEVKWRSRKISDSEYSFTATMMLNGVPVQVEKRFIFPEGKDFVQVVFNITNTGRKDVQVPNGYIIFSPGDFIGPQMDYESRYNTISSIYYIQDDFEQAHKSGDLNDPDEWIERENGTTGWVGIMSRYFLLIMMPEQMSGTGVIYDNREGTGFRTGMYMPVDTFTRNDTVTRSFKVYIGPKNKDQLVAVDKSLRDAADVNKWIEPIRDLVIWSLLSIDSLIGNLGWSLVIFSLLTKIVFLPLTQKSTESMKKMQELNPQIQELRNKYKEKPEVMNKKVMELYKKNKVNPMSGCLPLLLQMPFFFALYSALINSVDLWQAPFILWIQDLSLPDTVMQIQGFNLNILPVIMTITTFLQQKLSSVDAASQQQKFMMFMPLIILVVLWNMPSGLVIYWIMQNVLQVLHQLYINKKGKAEAAEA